MAEKTGDLGAEIRRLRKEAGLSQAALAAKLGKTKGYVSLLETGESKFRVGSAFAPLISVALGVPLSHWAPFTSDGHLVAESKQPTSHPIDRSDYRLIPDWGAVSAGPPRDPGSDAQMIPVTDLPAEGDFVSFVVRGSSMAPRIPDGSRIIVRVQPGAEPGETVVAWIDTGGGGAGLVLKKLKRVRKRLELHSDDGGNTGPIPFDTVRVVGVLRSYHVNVGV